MCYPILKLGDVCFCPRKVSFIPDLNSDRVENNAADLATRLYTPCQEMTFDRLVIAQIQSALVQFNSKLMEL